MILAAPVSQKETTINQFQNITQECQRQWYQAKGMFALAYSEIKCAPKKMHHSDLYPISVLEVRFYFFTCVL